MARHIPKYGIFIMESMDWNNERLGNLDGLAMKNMLDLSGIPKDYIYIRSVLELEMAVEQFDASDFGFLHIACHGGTDSLSLTLETVEFGELELIIGERLKYRRLFLSACHAACLALAQRFIPQYHCYSVMGSPNTINYDKAAIFWSAYYFLMHENDQQRMWQTSIIPMLNNLTGAFRLELNYFSIINERYPKARTWLREMHFVKGAIAFDRVQKTPFENKYWQEALDNSDSRQNALPDNSSDVF